MENFKIKKGNIIASIVCLFIGIASLFLSGFCFYNANICGELSESFSLFMFLCIGMMLGLAALPDLFPSIIYPKFASNMDNELKEYIMELPAFGIGAFFLGMFVISMLFFTEHPQDWAIYYLPLKVISILLLLLFEFKLVPGGSPLSRAAKYRYSNKEYIPNRQEELFNVIVSKYKSKLLIVLTAILYIAADLYIGMTRYNHNEINFDGVFFYLIFPGVMLGIVIFGVKFITAWWNLRTAMLQHSTDLHSLLEIKEFSSYNKKYRLPLPKGVTRFLVKHNVLDSRVYTDKK
jgi:hypothetical protein